MATIVNTPAASETSDGSSLGLMVGLMMAILVIMAFFFVGVPMFRGAAPAGSSAPAKDTAPQSQPQINIPDKIDVNINK